MSEHERWQPVPVPQGDGRHDIGDDVRAAIFRRLHDDFTLAAPWMTAEQRRQLAMFAAASVRALLHELGMLRDLAAVESATSVDARFTPSEEGKASGSATQTSPALLSVLVREEEEKKI